MNEDQVKGKWAQIKRKAKKAWAEFTDDDFQKAEGSEDKVQGVIQEKIGDSKEVIEANLDKPPV
jgi:uncharacterized protein YjbJ (UPF0337 family)